jgi:hypothetical protein
MATRVQTYTNDIRDNDIKTGKPVTAEQWKSISDLSNYLNGNGGTLIPCMSSFHNVSGVGNAQGIEPGETYTYKFSIYPRTPSHARLWIFRFASTHPYDAYPHTQKYFRGTVSLNGAAAWDFSSGNFNHTIFSTEQIYSPAETPVQITVAVANNAQSDDEVYIEQISCFEIPRHSFYTGESNVKSAQTGDIKPGRYIKEKSERSVFGPFEGVAEARETNRRNGVYHFSNPDGIDMTAAGWTDIYGLSGAVQHEALGRYLSSSTINANLRVNILAKVDSGTAQIGILPSYTAASSHTLNFSNTATAWHSTYGHLVPTRAEDLSTGDGRRNSVWSTIQYSARVVTANTLTIYAISVGEKADDN